MSNSKSAFTIIEIIVVVVIIGVLAAIAMPSYRIQMLKVKNQEAVRILTVLWEAQKDYFRDNGAYTNNIANLAIDIPAPKNFDSVAALPGSSLICNGTPEPALAEMIVSGAGYGLYVLENGRVVCSDSIKYPTTCHISICVKMGFKDDW